MPRYVRVPLTPEQADRIEHFKGTAKGIYLFEGSPHIDILHEHFERLVRVQAPKETLAETILSALETGLIAR